MIFKFLPLFLLSIFGIAASPVLADAGADSLRRFEFSHPQMGTVFRLVFFAENDSIAREAARETFASVDTLNAIMSDYLPDSELNRLCRKSGDGHWHRISPDLFDILKLSEKFARQSRGAFDVSIGPLTKIWRRARRMNELPAPEKIAEARQRIGYQNIELLENEAGLFCRINRPDMQLDLGGIAQGYAADRCLQILKKHGIARALADAGGDIALGGAPPERSGWEIDLPRADSLRKTLVLRNCGITTSGASYRYLEVGGIRYSHIVDPRTGMALTHRILATVQAPDATTADAWATAISVLGKKGWKKLRRKNRLLRVWLLETSL